MALGGKTIWRNIAEGGKRPFLVAPGKTWSYTELSRAIRQWLALFDKSDLRSGDFYVICTADEFLLCSGFIAGLLDGRVPVVLSADTPLPRLLAVSDAVSARLLVHDGSIPIAGPGKDVAQVALAGVEQQPARKGLFSRFGKGGERILPALPVTDEHREPALPDDPEGLAYVLFTSGTTSSPTGVKITRGNLYANCETLVRLFGYDANSRIFNDMVLAHADGMIQGPVLAAVAGGAVVRSGGFELSRLEQWLERVRETRSTHVITVPTIWAMVDSYAAHNDYFDAPECTSLQSVAAKLPEELWQRLETRFSRPIASHYGLTETVASALYAGPHAEMGERGTLGKPIDCEAQIDPEASVEGELQLRGPNIFPGYWQNDERTAASFTDDGWLRTGDIARLRKDGSYEILGRLKNIIMSGGFLIRPDEIDEAMLRHPAVRESVTVPLEDETFGEIAANAVVLQQNITPEDLAAHARENLEARKVPRKIMPVAEIPRGISGKPDLKAVVALFSPGTAQEQAASSEAPAKELEEAVVTLAADVFRVRRDTLGMASGPDTVDGWDSFSQLSLVLEAEARFGIRIPASRIARIEKLGDIRDAVREQLD